MTAWVAGLSFVSANLGALELMGWAAAAYQYGILATHWYWIGAIPAILFLGLVMMPFYYISKTHSVPGYLQASLRRSHARAFSAISFAFMTVLMSGINMYAMALVMKVVLGLEHPFQHLGFVDHGGRLRGSRRTVLRDFQRSAAVFPDLAGRDADPDSGLGGNGRLERAGRAHSPEFSARRLHPPVAGTLGHFSDNPMGIHWTGIVLGLGWVISFGYWNTDFLVVQRIFAAKDIRAAKMAPIIGSYFKMAVPFIVILPGLLGLAVLPFKLVPEKRRGPRPTQLQRSAAADAGALLRPGPAGSRHHCADCRVHVGHGGERQRVRHGVDL